MTSGAEMALAETAKKVRRESLVRSFFIVILLHYRGWNMVGQMIAGAHGGLNAIDALDFERPPPQLPDYISN
jgi:hypothetical protein